MIKYLSKHRLVKITQVPSNTVKVLIMYFLGTFSMKLQFITFIVLNL